VPDGAGVQAIVRPHDVRLARDDSDQKGQAVGTVTRIAPLGSHVKLQLSLPWNEAVTVQLSRVEAHGLNLMVGDRVVVDLARAKVFVGDYVI
jgi:ABC-type sulfate/molybdate transport systems ATPase subunit